MPSISGEQLGVGLAGHVWTVVLSAAVAASIPLLFGAAIVAQGSLGAESNGDVTDSLRLAMTMGELLLAAMPPMIWLGFSVWFLGSAIGLRSQRVSYWIWATWYGLTIAVGYVLVVFVLYPKSDFGRHAILTSELISIESAAGVAISILVGVVLGAVLRLLTPRWPTIAG